MVLLIYVLHHSCWQHHSLMKARELYEIKMIALLKVLMLNFIETVIELFNFCTF